MEVDLSGSRSSSHSCALSVEIMPVTMSTAWMVEFTLQARRRVSSGQSKRRTKRMTYREHQSPCSAREKSR